MLHSRSAERRTYGFILHFNRKVTKYLGGLVRVLATVRLGRLDQRERLSDDRLDPPGRYLGQGLFHQPGLADDRALGIAALRAGSIGQGHHLSAQLPPIDSVAK
jgi:hypothetical protein